MPKISTLSGDATSPRPKKNGIIVAHIVNNKGGWGKGFVLAVDKVSPCPKAAYKAWAEAHNRDIPLGETQFVEALPGYFVSNMCAQDGLKGTDENPCLVDYKALERCLRMTFHRAIRLSYHVHIPEGMGSGLAGGDKDTILKLIQKTAEEVEKKTTIPNPPELNIFLWKFDDTSANSYVAPVVADAPVPPPVPPVPPHPSATHVPTQQDAPPVEETGAKLTTNADDIAGLG